MMLAPRPAAPPNANAADAAPEYGMCKDKSNKQVFIIRKAAAGAAAGAAAFSFAHLDLEQLKTAAAPSTIGTDAWKPCSLSRVHAVKRISDSSFREHNVAFKRWCEEQVGGIIIPSLVGYNAFHVVAYNCSGGGESGHGSNEFFKLAHVLGCNGDFVLDAKSSAIWVDIPTLLGQAHNRVTGATLKAAATPALTPPAAAAAAAAAAGPGHDGPPDRLRERSPELQQPAQPRGGPLPFPTTAKRSEKAKQCAFMGVWGAGGDPSNHEEKMGGLPFASVIAVRNHTLALNQSDAEASWKHYMVCRVCTQSQRPEIMTNSKSPCLVCLCSEATTATRVCSSCVLTKNSTGGSFRNTHLDRILDGIKKVYKAHVGAIDYAYEFRVPGEDPRNGSMDKRVDLVVNVSGFNFSGNTASVKYRLTFFVELIYTEKGLMRLESWRAKLRALRDTMKTAHPQQMECHKAVFLFLRMNELPELQIAVLRQWISAFIQEARSLPEQKVTILTVGFESKGDKQLGAGRDAVLTDNIMSSLEKHAELFTEKDLVGKIMHCGAYQYPVRKEQNEVIQVAYITHPQELVQLLKSHMYKGKKEEEMQFDLLAELRKAASPPTTAAAAAAGQPKKAARKKAARKKARTE